LGTQGWSARGNVGAALGYYHRALSLKPDSNVWLSALILWSWAYGHAEEALAAAERYAKLRPENTQAQILHAQAKGDFAEIARRAAILLANPSTPGAYSNGKWTGELALASLHDIRGARRILAAGLLAPSPYANIITWRIAIQTLAAMEDWPSLLAREPEAEKAIRGIGLGWDFGTEFNRIMRPRLALAKAHLGDLAGAEALIAVTPLDCYDCLRIRGQVADLAGRPSQADAWFKRAIHDAPSLPFAYTEWGQALLARGQPDAAVVQFKRANEKGPHFADPLEGWGEALMAKNQSHRALAKFAEAEKYAPNWGRLHLKWGQALAYAGKRDVARAQFARAARLDLTPSEKAELAKAMPHV
jgi:tetratricopeptide (TPR) repeat protein